MRTFIYIGIVLAVAATCPTPAHAAGGNYFAGYYVNLSGARYYQGYVPSTYRGDPVPLVVGLHGCLEPAGDFQALSQLHELAERRGFIVVFPEQSVLANPSRCWNFFLSANQSRGRGEPSLIAGITQWVRDHWNIDSRRTHVMGISAGAAMAVVMGATYPDLYASIGVHSGAQYKVKALPLLPGDLTDPIWAGNEIYQAMGARRRVVPVIAFVGSLDIVAPPSATANVISSWAQANDRAADGVDDDNIDDVAEQTIAGQVPGGKTYTRKVYTDSNTGHIVLEKYLVNGMGHEWSGGPWWHIGADWLGPDATSIMYDFFLAHPR